MTGLYLYTFFFCKQIFFQVWVSVAELIYWSSQNPRPAFTIITAFKWLQNSWYFSRYFSRMWYFSLKLHTKMLFKRRVAWTFIKKHSPRFFSMNYSKSFTTTIFKNTWRCLFQAFKTLSLQSYKKSGCNVHATNIKICSNLTRKT